MPLTDLRQAISDAADDLSTIAPSVGNKGKAYEVWALFEIAVRLMRTGYEVRVHDPADIEAGAFRVRGSPGGMPDADAPGDENPSHFVIEGARSQLEIHVGLQVEGVSGAKHEIDITILPAEAGRALRDAGGGPYSGKLSVGLELKAYDGKHKLNQGFPRALLGVAVDVDPAWLFPMNALITHGGAVKNFQVTNRTLFGIVTSTELYDNSRKLLAHHGVLAAEALKPGQAEGVLDRLADAIADELGSPSRLRRVKPRRFAVEI